MIPAPSCPNPPAKPRASISVVPLLLHSQAQHTMTHLFAVLPRRQSSSATICSIRQSMMMDSLCMSMTCTRHILLMQMARYHTTSMTKQCTKMTSPFMVQVSFTQRDLLCLRTATRLCLFRSGRKRLDPFVPCRLRSRAYMCVCERGRSGEYFAFHTN